MSKTRIFAGVGIGFVVIGRDLLAPFRDSKTPPRYGRRTKDLVDETFSFKGQTFRGAGMFLEALEEELGCLIEDSGSLLNPLDDRVFITIHLPNTGNDTTEMVNPTLDVGPSILFDTVSDLRGRLDTLAANFAHLGVDVGSAKIFVNHAVY